MTHVPSELPVQHGRPSSNGEQTEQGLAHGATSALTNQTFSSPTNSGIRYARTAYQQRLMTARMIKNVSRRGNCCYTTLAKSFLAPQYWNVRTLIGIMKRKPRQDSLEHLEAFHLGHKIGCL